VVGNFQWVHVDVQKSKFHFAQARYIEICEAVTLHDWGVSAEFIRSLLLAFTRVVTLRGHGELSATAVALRSVGPQGRKAAAVKSESPQVQSAIV
jgi:hypothetical protein